MDAAYGIGVKNRYAFLLDEGDDSSDPYAPVTNSADQDPKSKVAGQKSAVNNKTAPSTPGSKSNAPDNKSSAFSESKQNVVANEKYAGRQNRPRPLNNSNQRPFNRENQENRNNRSPRNNFSFENKDDDAKAGRDLRGENKDGRRNAFGSRGRRGGSRPFGGKRDFNRHSGSDKAGVKPVEKREGGGAHNWGKSVDDFTAPPENEEQVNGEKPLGTENRSENEEYEGEAAENAEQELQSNEPQFKTLDEYKRELEEKRLHTQFNIRKAGEGEDKSKWKKTYVLKKKQENDEDEVEYEEIEVEESTGKRRNRQVLDIEVNFQSEDGRDVRRGRGGGRGGRRPPDSDRRPPVDADQRQERRPRGGNVGSTPRDNARPSGRGGRDRNSRFQAAPKFDDLNDFPSLSS